MYRVFFAKDPTVIDRRGKGVSCERGPVENCGRAAGLSQSGQFRRDLEGVGPTS